MRLLLVGMISTFCLGNGGGRINRYVVEQIIETALEKKEAQYLTNRIELERKIDDLIRQIEQLGKANRALTAIAVTVGGSVAILYILCDRGSVGCDNKNK